MTPTPDLSTEAAPAKADDDGANDLEAIRSKLYKNIDESELWSDDIFNLIAEVEMLQDEVAGYDTLFDLAAGRERPWIEAWRRASGKPDTLPDYGEMLNWLCSRAEAAAAREAVLAGVLEEIGSGPCCGTESCCEDDPKCDAMMARAALATTRPQALERARAVEAKGYAAGLEAAAQYVESHVWTTPEKQSKAIRALDKEGP